MSLGYYVNTKLTPNPESEAFKKGYSTRKGGGWWRGCPYLHDTQEFRDWLAGWQLAYDEPAKHAKIIAKMERKLKSLQNATKRYRTVCQSTYNVVDGYNDAKEEMMEAGLWIDWCKKHGYSPSHEASDMFA